MWFESQQSIIGGLIAKNIFFPPIDGEFKTGSQCAFEYGQSYQVGT